MQADSSKVFIERGNGKKKRRNGCGNSKRHNYIKSHFTILFQETRKQCIKRHKGILLTFDHSDNNRHMKNRGPKTLIKCCYSEEDSTTHLKNARIPSHRTPHSPTIMPHALTSPISFLRATPPPSDFSGLAASFSEPPRRRAPSSMVFYVLGTRPRWS